MLLSSTGSSPNTVYFLNYLKYYDYYYDGYYYDGYSLLSISYNKYTGNNWGSPKWKKLSSAQISSSIPMGLEFGETEDFIYSYGL